MTYGGFQTEAQHVMFLLRRKSTDERLTRIDELTILTVAELLEIHEDTGLSLDNWQHARELCEAVVREALPDEYPNWTLTENGA